MSDGYQKQRLTEYLSGANEKAISDSGTDWKNKGLLLEAVADALQKRGPELSEKLGKDSLTAAQLKTSLMSSANSMGDTGGKLKAAGEALVIVGDNLEKARVSRKAMKSLVEPPPYTTPSYNGAQPTPDQIQQDADARGASNKEHGRYQSAHAGQEADAAEITANLDQAFLSAIPPMMAIHGGPDPTAPTPGDKDGPGTNAPPPVNRTNERGVRRAYAIFSDRDGETDAERREREREERERQREHEQREQMERERERQRELAERERLEQERLERERLERERLERERLEHKDPIHTSKSPTTNVGGGTDSGASYQGVSDGSSVSGSASSTSAGVGGAAAAGAAGAGLGAGAMKGGAIGGSAAAPVGGTVRGIGAGGQSASSLSRGSTAAGSPSRAASAGARGGAASGTSAASRSTAAGSASRSAGAGSRAGAAGSTSSNRGTAGKGGAGRGSAGRSGAAGSTSGKGSAKGKSKGLFRRGSNGSTSGGRSNKLDDERNAGRDALVYEQDWLGDETAAPSVLD